MSVTDHMTQENIRELGIRARGLLPASEVGAVAVAAVRITGLK